MHCLLPGDGGLGERLEEENTVQFQREYSVVFTINLLSQYQPILNLSIISEISVPYFNFVSGLHICDRTPVNLACNLSVIY